MQLRYSFRIHPTAGQCKSPARAFGCARVVWNDALRLRQDAHAAGLPFPKSADLSKSLITQAKKTPEREWLSGAPVGVLQQSLRDQDRAWRNSDDTSVQALVKTIARVRPVDAGTITWHGGPVRPTRGGARESAACGGSG
ncbi:helix-turn-helix domain-containing protein [Kitasatospora sp. NPDC101155]|uniref:helix-turn-helix domain-containing protein n=1 Tax=Kitasatospora sp. NPDC101155 TaxID=3364097 RepID=UPI0037F74445